MRLIDADALIDDAMDRYCKECDKRKGIKNGKWRIVYEIGEVPCRACDVDDMIDDLENAPTVDAVSVVHCKDCKWQSTVHDDDNNSNYYMCGVWSQPTDQDAFCSWGERRSE